MQAVGIHNIRRIINERPNLVTKSMAANDGRRNKSNSAWEARISLLLAIATQTASLSSRVLTDLYSETTKYVVPKQFEAPTLDQAFMSVPDLETIKFKVLSRMPQYEIRQLEPYFVAEVNMPGSKGFDFYGASQSFNMLAEYLFGKNIANEKMEMTTPVSTRKSTSGGEKMEMTTPVITRRAGGQEAWVMSFVMPSKYGAKLPLPKDSAVRIKEVSNKIVAVAVFSGYVTDEEVKQRESMLRDALKNDKEYHVKVRAQVEVLQYNPPFTLPFTRRNEVALEVERRQISS
ncbi:heme-binding-like protein At3g10130, chloroplastic [Silene latifolia]|uniref:heme-binding-like protein At3g10130, chloroplastic n=1 Tax=Silene latifolia TaxID=37657 RepID=UPI003D773A22